MRIAYIAFLRGINVGGHGVVKMAELRNAFEAMGFASVRTLLASGNVIFETERKDRKALTREIESRLAAFKKDIRVVLRGLEDIRALQESDPFKGIKVTPSVRLYVTFLSEKAESPAITIPYATPQKEFRILRASRTEVFSVLDLSKGKGTPDVMNVLEKEFGSNNTTRNWNTVLKALA